MTTISDHAVKIMNAQYTKTAVRNVLTYLTELYETSLKEKVAIDSDSAAGSFRHASIWSIESLAELHEAINNLHLVMDLQNKIINPDEEPVSPVDELRRKVAEAAKGGLKSGVTQTTSRYKLVSTPAVDSNTDTGFESELPGLEKLFNAAVKEGFVGSSFNDWLISVRGRNENDFRRDEQEREARRLAGTTKEVSETEERKLEASRGYLQNMDAGEQEAHRAEMRRQEAVYGCISEDTPATAVTPPEPSGALPKVVAIHDGPAPPKNSLEVLVSHESPLCEIFSPSPWLPEGRGTITVGSKDFSYYKDVDPTKKDGKTRATLPNAFYGGDGQPKWVLIRLRTCALLWDFKFDVESMSVYMAGVSDAKASEEPRWFKASELSASFSARLLSELNRFKEEIQ